MSTIKRVLKYLLSLFFVLAGAYHFVNPPFYLKMMPPYLPLHFALVYISGVAEIVLGILLVVPTFTRVAGWGLVVLLIAIFPANIHMATHPEQFPHITPIALWLRLPLQGILIAWAFWYTRSNTNHRDNDVSTTLR